MTVRLTDHRDRDLFATCHALLIRWRRVHPTLAAEEETLLPWVRDFTSLLAELLTVEDDELPDAPTATGQPSRRPR